MKTPVSSVDAASRRWLTVLAVVFLGSTAYLAHAFIKALSSPGEENAVVQQPMPENANATLTRSELTWIAPPEVRALDEHQTAASVFPPDNKEKKATKRDDAATRETAHSQAEYLRALVKQNKLPDAYGHLTLEQIDEMEKKNILIE